MLAGIGSGAAGSSNATDRVGSVRTAGGDRQRGHRGHEQRSSPPRPSGRPYTVVDNAARFTVGVITGMTRGGFPSDLSVLVEVRKRLQHNQIGKQDQARKRHCDGISSVEPEWVEGRQ